MTTCSNCGGKLLADDAFCYKCGKPVEHKKLYAKCGVKLHGGVVEPELDTKPETEYPIACPNCGKTLLAGILFCNRCGQAVNNETLRVENEAANGRTEKVAHLGAEQDEKRKTEELQIEGDLFPHHVNFISDTIPADTSPKTRKNSTNKKKMFVSAASTILIVLALVIGKLYLDMTGARSNLAVYKIVDALSDTSISYNAAVTPENMPPTDGYSYALATTYAYFKDYETDYDDSAQWDTAELRLIYGGHYELWVNITIPCSREQFEKALSNDVSLKEKLYTNVIGPLKEATIKYTKIVNDYTPNLDAPYCFCISLKFEDNKLGFNIGEGKLYPGGIPSILSKANG